MNKAYQHHPKDNDKAIAERLEALIEIESIALNVQADTLSRLNEMALALQLIMALLADLASNANDPYCCQDNCARKKS